MQRRNVKKGADANADVSQVSAEPAVIKKASTAATISSSTTTNATTAAAPSPSSSPDANDLRSSTRFILLRSFLLVVIFLILFTFTQNHILTPYFQPERTAAYQARQQAAMKQQIARHVCPDGIECSYNLKEEYKI